MAQTRKMRGTRRRGSARKTTSIRITKRDGSLYVGGVAQKPGWWIDVSRSVLYISRNANRIYWMLNKVRPTITFSDQNQSVTMGNNRLVLTSPTLYERVKSILSVRHE